MEDQDCDENMPTGLGAMIQNDVVPIISDRDEKAGFGSGGGASPPYNMQTPAAGAAGFLSFQQMNPGEYPCSEEIIFHDLEKVLKSSTSHQYMMEEMQTAEEILFHEENEVQEDDPGQHGQPGQEFQQQKRKRSSHVHNLNERLRRQKLQGKMKALQQLIPNCDKENHMMSLMGSAGNFSVFHSPVMMPQLPAGMQIPTLPQFPPTLGIEYGTGTGMGMGMDIPMYHSGLHGPYAMEPGALSGSSSSSGKLIPESAHSSIQTYPGGNYVMPPWPGITFPTSVSQGTTSPAQGTTRPAEVQPTQLILNHAARENRSSNSGSSERFVSCSVWALEIIFQYFFWS
ncbi:hypothetical protein ABFX02_05G125950 [Erythranthe guttata]